MVIRTNEGAQARGLLAARTKYSRSKAQHIRELCHKDVRNTAILGNYAIKSMKMSRIKGGLGEIQRFFCPLEQKNFRTTRPFCTSKKYIGAQKPQRKPASPSFYSSYSLFEFYKSALKFAWPHLRDHVKFWALLWSNNLNFCSNTAKFECYSTKLQSYLC